MPWHHFGKYAPASFKRPVNLARLQHFTVKFSGGTTLISLIIAIEPFVKPAFVPEGSFLVFTWELGNKSLSRQEYSPHCRVICQFGNSREKLATEADSRVASHQPRAHKHEARVKLSTPGGMAEDGTARNSSIALYRGESRASILATSPVVRLLASSRSRFPGVRVWPAPCLHTSARK